MGNIAAARRRVKELIVHIRHVLPVMAGMVASLLLAPPAQAVMPPQCATPQSLGMQVKPDYDTPETLKTLSDLGVSYVRRGFYWKGIEPTEGKFVFDEYDKLLGECEKLNLGMVAVLFGEQKDYEDDGKGGIQTEAGRKGFANFGAELARRYKGKKVMWEVWNEPNTKTFWNKSAPKGNSDEFAAEYTALVKETAAAMLKADPQCVVLGGSLSNYWDKSYEWTEYCFKRGILNTGIAAWSVHPYGMKTPEEHETGHAVMRDLFKKYGKPDMPILNTERGFAVKKPTGNYEGWSGGSEKEALEYQSWHLVRQYLIDQMCNVPLTMWYEWQGDKFGLVDNGKQRPVTEALKVLVAQLSGYHFAERVKTQSELDYVLVFRNDAGQRKLVVWTAPPQKGTPDQAKAHRIDIPVTGSQLTVTDIYGKHSKTSAQGGKISVEISGSPIYVQ